MCNLYSIIGDQAAISALFRVVNRRVGNLDVTAYRHLMLRYSGEVIVISPKHRSASMPPSSFNPDLLHGFSAVIRPAILTP